MEQFNLDFGPEQEKPGKPATPDPETLPDDELAALYKETIGIDPIIRTFDRKTMLQGLAAGRDAETDRIRELDKAADIEELAKPYRR
ncbi:MAG: hypothetical protein KBD19_01370 [Candidatus Moranbacteria bacterium]|nr:hypothetical protein [Candidatus Moranbacteria bacterium]